MQDHQRKTILSLWWKEERETRKEKRKTTESMQDRIRVTGDDGILLMTINQCAAYGVVAPVQVLAHEETDMQCAKLRLGRDVSGVGRFSPTHATDLGVRGRSDPESG